MEKKFAIIVVDMINEFVKGKISAPSAREIIPNVQELIKEAKSKNIPIFYCNDNHTLADPELVVWGPHAMKDTKESEIIDDLKVETNDYIIPKTTYSSFFKTELNDKLQALGITDVVVIGAYTDICVKHTVADAFLNCYKVYVDLDCVAALNSDKREEDLEYFKNIYAASLVTHEEVFKLF